MLISGHDLFSLKMFSHSKQQRANYTEGEMHSNLSIDRVVDLTDPARNAIYNMSVEAAKKRLISGNSEAVRAIDGINVLILCSKRFSYACNSKTRLSSDVCSF